MKNVIKILLFLLGFPLMILCVYLASRTVFEQGGSYGFWILGGIGVSALVTVLFFITFLITGIVSKKSGKLKTIRRSTAAMVMIAVILTTGVWIAVDSVLPGILKDATDGTIKYDEYRHDIEAKALFHGELLTKFIEWNCANGNLTEMSVEGYLEEGWKNEEVKALITSSYTSLNDDGYTTFVGPWLPFADGGRLTVPVLFHLVVNKREQSTVAFQYNGEGRKSAGKENDPITWSILDMQQGSMEVDLSGILGDPLFGAILDIAGGSVDKIITILHNILDVAVADEAIAGATIYIRLDLEEGKLTITPTSESRGVWDYMHQAWFNSNNLLFLVISLLPARNVFLMFSGLLVILCLLIGLIRESQYAKDKKDKKGAMIIQTNTKQAPPGLPISENRRVDQGYKPKAAGSDYVMEFDDSPYMQALARAIEESNNRNRN